MARIKKIMSSDGTLVPFDEKDITRSIYQATVLAGAPDYELAEELADVVTFFIERNYVDSYPTHEDISEWVERVLLETADPEIAKAFILWREEQKKINADKSSKNLREPTLFDDFEISVVGSDNEISLWDRRKIHEDLIIKTGVARKVAEDIAYNVEEKVFSIGKAKITSKLIRALIDAELIELGYYDIQAEHEPAVIEINAIDEILQRGRRSDSKPPLTSASDIDDYISRKIFQQYAARRIFSPPIIEAIQNGQLFSRAFPNPLKFRKITFTLDCLKEGIPGEKSAVNFDEFITQLVQYINQLFKVSDAVEIQGFTWAIAPLLRDLPGDVLLNRYKRILLALTQFKDKNLQIEINYKAPNLVDKLSALDLNKQLISSGKTIGEFNDTIKNLALMTFELILGCQMLQDGIHTIFKFDWKDIFQPANIKILENSTICASEFGNVKYQLEDDNIKGMLNSSSQKTHCILNSFSINVPQAAYSANNNENNFTELLEHMMEITLQAITEHHVFLQNYFNRFNLPIFKNPEHPATLSMKNFKSEIRLMGLTPAIMYMFGEKKRWAIGKKGKRRGFDTTINLFEENKPIENEISKSAVKFLSYLQFKLKEKLESLDFDVSLHSETDYDATEFFWSYDRQHFGANTEFFVFNNLINIYPPGFEIIDESINHMQKTREQARIAGIIGGKDIYVNALVPSLKPQEILNLLKSVFSIKTSRQLAICIPAVRCLSCGNIKTIKEQKPVKCSRCSGEILQSGEMRETQFYPKTLNYRYETNSSDNNPHVETL